MRDTLSRLFTRLLRFARRFLRDPKDAFYNLARYLYEKLPGSLRRRLGNLAIRNLPKDATWEEFQAEVLSNRDCFKGLFIQEIIIDWGLPLFQRPQHLATALGKLGYLVIYRTANHVADNVNGVRKVAENVWITNCEQVNQLPGAVHSIYSTSFYFDIRSFIHNASHERFLVYEYIDHIDPMISGSDENVKRLHTLREFALNGGADLIVASSHKLEREAIAEVGNEKVVYLQNGVDVTHYRDPVHETFPISRKLTAFRKRYSHIIGYFGAMASWLWYDAINELAHLRPDLGFVYIGPDYHHNIDRLPFTRNILYLGTIDYGILPAHARQFDVCFIPFAPGEIAHTTSPLKLFEYFALEKPVVTTSFMDECVAFPEVFHGDSVQSLSNAIDRAIAVKDDPAYRYRLARLADENSWLERAKHYEAIFIRPAEFSIRTVQKIISECYAEDGKTDNYYDTAYKFQEMYYWMPVPGWISRLKNIKSVIDIGSAYGTLLLYAGLVHEVKSMVAIDPVEYMSPSLKNRYGIHSYPLDIDKESISQLGKFDLVVFTEVIEHLNYHPLPALMKIKELMHSDSHLVLSTPDADEWGRVTEYYRTVDEIPYFSGQQQERIDSHIYQYTRDEIESLFRAAGLRIEKFSYSPGVNKQHLCYLLRLDD
jgi:SAM-dependent methyltransferase